MMNSRFFATRTLSTDACALALACTMACTLVAPAWSSPLSAQRGAKRPAADVAPAAPALTAEALQGIQLRSIGPGLVTGRIADIKIDPKNPSTWYIATAFGGIWKTTNRGASFTPIFDNGGTHNSCCIVIDPKNSDVLWLGTGENDNQRSAH